MIIKPSRWTQDDIKEANSVLYYILGLLYYYKKKEVKFEDLVWVTAEANKICFNKYCFEVINGEIFNLFDYDQPLLLDNFIPGIGWRDYLSEAVEESIDKAFFRWKLYGKYIVYYINLKWKLKHKTIFTWDNLCYFAEKYGYEERDYPDKNLNLKVLIGKKYIFYSDGTTSIKMNKNKNGYEVYKILKKKLSYKKMFKLIKGDK